MMKDHVFGHGTTTSMFGNPESFRIVKLQEKVKEKEKANVDSKELVMHTLVKNKHQDSEWWSEEDSVWWSKSQRGKKGSSTTNNYLSGSDFRTYHPEKSTGNEYHPFRGRGKDQKRKKARKVSVLNQDFQPPKHLVKKDMVIHGNQTIGSPATGLTIPQHQLLDGHVRELILHGWHQSL